MLKRLNSFTLAEVLITLGIIGIVAGMTIPILMQNIQDAQLKTAWKNTYSILSQAAINVMHDNGDTFKSICNGVVEAVDGSDCLKSKFSPYLSYVKDCTCYNGTGTLGDCWANQTYAGDGKTPYYSSWVTEINTKYSGLVLKNGAFVVFEQRSPTCTDSIYNRCGIIQVDVNGSNKPNTYGRDIFHIGIFVDRIAPLGATIYSFGELCPAPSSANGSQYYNTSCAADYLYK